ncbi:hypothetical protein OKA06_15480 [Novosphingobium sp. MW5]|nr:hypothetical protein [Novosphingobium sp. MW5]
MGMLDGILGQLGGNVDIGGIAAKYGIPAELAEKAVAALGQSHAEPGDTIEGAAAKTGLDTGVLGQIAGQLGGEGGLGQLSDLMKGAGGLGALGGLAGMLDRDGDGNPLNDLGGLAGGLFGKS